MGTTDRKCPGCGSERMRRSRARTLFERWRKSWSAKRIHRCHDCGWRGWRTETHLERYQELDADFTPPDFNEIDAAVPLRGARSTPRERS